LPDLNMPGLTSRPHTKPHLTWSGLRRAKTARPDAGRRAPHSWDIGLDTAHFLHTRALWSPGNVGRVVEK